MAIALYSNTAVTVPNTTAVDGGTGSNRCIIFATCADTSDNMTAVTWNGESLTKGLTQSFPAIGRYNYIWYLYSPVGTGTHDLVISGAGGGGSASQVLVYTGVGSAPHDFVQSTGSGTSIANTHTVIAGDWIVGGAGNDASAISAGANTTMRSASSSQGQADSNGASTSALNYTHSSGNNAAYGCVISIPTGTAYNMAVTVGEFILTGIDSILRIALNMATTVGDFVLSGIDAIFALGKGITASVGEFILTGSDAFFTGTRTMATTVGEFILTGIDAGLGRAYNIAVSVGQFVLTGMAIRLPIFWRNVTKNVVTVRNVDRSNI